MSYLGVRAVGRRATGGDPTTVRLVLVARTGCRTKGCTRRHHARGYCSACYRRRRKHRLKLGPRRARPTTETLADWPAVAHESPEVACARLGMSPSAIRDALRRAGRPDLARPFDALDRRLRKARRNTEQAA